MNIKQILENNDFSFKKKFGQNFLTDCNVLDNIIKTSKVTDETLAIEIGVGAAALTKKLSSVAKNVLGYEIDTSLKEPLNTILNDYNNVDIIYDDFLKRNIANDIKKYNYKNLMVVANLPYYITTPIITKFITDKIDVSRIVIMIQNEVADRFCAVPGSKNYNSLSIYLNYYFEIKKAFFVSRNVFYPKPNVDSAVVVLEKRTNKVDVLDETLFFSLVKASFTQKRKTLKNNLKNYDINLINDVLKMHGKDINYRAEAITIEEFAEISNLIAKHKNV